ncbi:MAG: response regulator [Sandaracinus sp.]|nr:response regulator [Sandaracinus sp.]
MRFGAAGFEVVVAREASRRWRCSAASSVDLVVTEVDLGERDGFTLPEKMRSADHTMPVVFLTRRSEGASVDRWLRARRGRLRGQARLP